MDISKETIDRLIMEAIEGLGYEEIYNMALPHVDVEDLYNRQPIPSEEMAITFSVAGFVEGIRFALENLNIEYIEDDDRAEKE